MANHSENATTQRSECPESYEACVEQAQSIPQHSKLYGEAQSILKQCTAGLNWQTTTVQIFPNPSSMVWSVALSPDGQTIASGGEDGTVKLWARNTGNLIRTLPKDEEEIYTVAFSPDGHHLMSGAHDIKIWNPQTGELRTTLPGHSKDVTAVAVTPDGKALISGGKDWAIKLWQR